MAVSKRKALQLAEFQAEVLRLFRQGLKQSEIARRLSLPAGPAGEMRVSRALAAVKVAWKASALRDFDAEKGRILNELEAVKEAAWAAFERSRRGRVRKRDKELLGRKVKACCRGDEADAGEGDGGADAGPPEDLVPVRRERERTAERRDGDPRFLQVVLNAVAEEAEILGIVARPGEQSTSPPIVAFKILCRPDHPREVVDGTVASPRPEVGLKEPPPGADPDDHEQVVEGEGR
jgi:hypothetical protein